MTAPIEVDGARELRRQLKKVEGGIADLKAQHAAAAKTVEERAYVLAPRRTGHLANTLRSSGQVSGGIVRAGYASVPYAGPIHFGWPFRPNPAKGWMGGPIPPNPWMYDALDERRDEVIAMFEERVAGLINKYDLD